MTTITIKSQLGAEISLTMSDTGVVTASVNGKVYHGEVEKQGVLLLGSTRGKYLKLAPNGAALIDGADVAKTEKFFAAARPLIEAENRRIAIAQHNIDMLNPAYAAMIAHDNLVAAMDRPDSDY